jgi:hypothetical protein
LQILRGKWLGDGLGQIVWGEFYELSRDAHRD